MNNYDIPALEQTIEKYPWFSIAYLELYKKVCELGEEHKHDYLKRSAAYLCSREKLYDVSKKEETTKGYIVERNAIVEKDEVIDKHEVVVKIEVAEREDPIEKDEVLEREMVFEIETFTEEESASEKDGNEEISFEIEQDPLHVKETSKMILAGGDYFNKLDFEELKLDTTMPLDKFIVEKPTLLRTNPILSQKENLNRDETKVEENFEDSGFYTETLAKIYSGQGFNKRALEVYSKLILVYPEKSSYFAALVQEIKSKHN